MTRATLRRTPGLMDLDDAWPVEGDGADGADDHDATLPVEDDGDEAGGGSDGAPWTSSAVDLERSGSMPTMPRCPSRAMGTRRAAGATGDAGLAGGVVGARRRWPVEDDGDGAGCAGEGAWPRRTPGLGDHDARWPVEGDGGDGRCRLGIVDHDAALPVADDGGEADGVGDGSHVDDERDG